MISDDMAGVSTPAPGRVAGAETLCGYIDAHWDRTVRTSDGTAGELALPCRFMCPTVGETFRSLFYWDTFYACTGLVLQGREALVEECLRCFLHLIDELGFVPNMTTIGEINRTQLPHAWALVDLLDRHRGGDDELVRGALPRLEREWAFYAAMRSTPDGLNRPGHHADPAYLHRFFGVVDARIPGAPTDPAERLRWTAHSLAEAEVWDFTPRFDRRAMDFNPIDLNALLFAHEAACVRWAARVGQDADAERWRERRDRRQASIQKLWNEEAGWFTDLDTTTGEATELRSAAGLYALWCGVATPEQAKRMVAQLDCVLFEHGVSACEQRDASGPAYQWDAPNAWAPIQFAAVEGLRRYGFAAEVREAVRRFSATVARNFDATGELWEKYNAATGGVDAADESPMPPMLGWTAGVFVHFDRFLSGADQAVR